MNTTRTNAGWGGPLFTAVTELEEPLAAIRDLVVALNQIDIQDDLAAVIVSRLVSYIDLEREKADEVHSTLFKLTHPSRQGEAA